MNNTNLKQLFRRYSDGTLVAKDEMYNKFFGYQHVQTTPSMEWIVQHNIGEIAIYNIFSDNQEIVPSEIIEIDSCSTVIRFNQSVSGFANIVFLNIAGSPYTCS